MVIIEHRAVEQLAHAYVRTLSIKGLSRLKDDWCCQHWCLMVDLLLLLHEFVVKFFEKLLQAQVDLCVDFLLNFVRYSTSVVAVLCIVLVNAANALNRMSLIWQKHWSTFQLLLPMAFSLIRFSLPLDFFALIISLLLTFLFLSRVLSYLLFLSLILRLC